MVGHVGSRVFLIIFTVVLFIIVSTINYLSTVPGQIIFQNASSVLSERYATEVTLSDFAYVGIWIAIYLYLTLFLIYACGTLFRPSGPGYLYTHPNYLPPAVYIAFCVAQLSSLVWVFTWDNELLEVSLFFAFLTMVAAYVSLAVASHGLFTNQKALVSHGYPNEYKWVYFLVINPLGLYAMWVTIRSLINLSVVLVYLIDVTQNAAGSISLTILVAVLIAYSLIDLAFYERYFRYLYTPYLVIIWSFAGILVRNLDWGKSNTVFTFGLICVTVAVFVLKFFLSVFRCLRKPLFHDARAMGNFKVSAETSAGPSFAVAQPLPSVPSKQPALPSWPSLS